VESANRGREYELVAQDGIPIGIAGQVRLREFPNRELFHSILK